MPKILVLFHSRTGDTASLAEAVADGVRSVRFAEVVLRGVDDPALAEELAACDAIILGTSLRDGAVPAEVTHVLDQAAALRHSGALLNKVGSAFTPRARARDGHESALWSLLIPMANLGMIIVPPLSSGAGPREGGAPAEAELTAARDQGKRVAEVTGWITHARSHHHH